MINNHKECSNDITLENLKCLVQIYWGCKCICRESNEGKFFALDSLAFSNFLSWQFSVAIHAL